MRTKRTYHAAAGSDAYETAADGFDAHETGDSGAEELSGDEARSQGAAPQSKCARREGAGGQERQPWLLAGPAAPQPQLQQRNGDGAPSISQHHGYERLPRRAAAVAGELVWQEALIEEQLAAAALESEDDAASNGRSGSWRWHAR